ncbi:hypothetical protein BDP27DRAFT_1428227 [Rhodocollybia butyracea]|uniref:Uncharacterized protein n=1 Tax=Rhodocollybia butyracea TaxID=206335 RepID=A0A9P5PF19_9AGAR|nr:hypothetical protein BDP27DRAFT_1428227 [Rhodocollybia butyracea]
MLISIVHAMPAPILLGPLALRAPSGNTPPENTLAPITNIAQLEPLGSINDIVRGPSPGISITEANLIYRVTVLEIDITDFKQLASMDFTKFPHITVGDGLRRALGSFISKAIGQPGEYRYTNPLTKEKIAPLSTIVFAVEALGNGVTVCGGDPCVGWRSSDGTPIVMASIFQIDPKKATPLVRLVHNAQSQSDQLHSISAQHKETIDKHDMLDADFWLFFPRRKFEQGWAGLKKEIEVRIKSNAGREGKLSRQGSATSRDYHQGQ